MTWEELKKLAFHARWHMSMEHEHTTTYMSDDNKIGFCDHQPYKNGEPHGRAYRHYYLDGKVYRSKEKFITALADYQPDS